MITFESKGKYIQITRWGIMSRNPPYAPWISHDKWWVYLEVYKFKMVTGSVGMSPWSMEVQTQISKCWFTWHIHLVVPKVTNPIFFSLNKKITLLFAQLVIVYMSWWLGSSSNQPLIVTYYYNKIWPKKKKLLQQTQKSPIHGTYTSCFYFNPRLFSANCLFAP